MMIGEQQSGFIPRKELLFVLLEMYREAESSTVLIYRKQIQCQERMPDERCGVGVADGFKVGVGLCQGSAMSPYVFVVSDIWNESQVQVEESLER